MKSKSVISLMKYFILGCFLVTTINQISAQSSAIYKLTEQDFQEISTSNKASKSSTYVKPIDEIKQGFFNLKKGLKPTIYVNNNKVKKVSGISPQIVKFQNSYSLDVLKENNSLIKNVELLTIRMKNRSELNNRIDFSNIDTFNNLKYIFIQCNFNCTANEISSFIKNADPKVIIFYMVGNPS